MRVLFISKPIAPPFKDGTKCLVRDIVTHLKETDPIILSTRGAPELAPRSPGARIRAVPIYANGGDYAPALTQNLRAALWVLLQSRAEVWHFVFAPNPRTSQVGRLLRSVRRRPVVQTIASSPRSFSHAAELLFGDIVVAQSAWTERRVREAYAREGLTCPRLCVIPPPVPTELVRSPEQARQARSLLSIPASAPLFVYPGDLEVSSGARVAEEIAARVGSALPGSVVVFAYRRKTAAADTASAELKSRLDPRSTRLVESSSDVLSLIASATAVIFPVDDLWGKVDLPIVLLETMALGVPVVALAEGPLAELEGARLIPSLDPEAWVHALNELTRESTHRAACIEAQRVHTLSRCAAPAVAAAYERLYLELAGN